jgi:hypothetical protein
LGRYLATNVIQDRGYQDGGYQDDNNIKFEDREKYIQVIGNYHPYAEEYNPARLSINLPVTQNTLMTSQSIRFSNEEINAFVFNHVHCQYSNDDEVDDQVMFDHPNAEFPTIKLPTNDRKGFFKKIESYDSSDDSSDEPANIAAAHVSMSSSNESNNSFAKQLYKTLEDPSSISDTINSIDVWNRKIKADGKKKNNNLKTLFYFDV